MPRVNPKCPHRQPPKLGYIAMWEDVNKRVASGEKHRKCPVCQRWVWESFYRKNTLTGQRRKEQPVNRASRSGVSPDNVANQQ